MYKIILTTQGHEVQQIHTYIDRHTHMYNIILTTQGHEIQQLHTYIYRHKHMYNIILTIQGHEVQQLHTSPNHATEGVSGQPQIVKIADEDTQVT